MEVIFRILGKHEDPPYKFKFVQYKINFEMKNFHFSHESSLFSLSLIRSSNFFFSDEFSVAPAIFLVKLFLLPSPLSYACLEGSYALAERKKEDRCWRLNPAPMIFYDGFPLSCQSKKVEGFL